jgi:hypothetical protein
MDSQKTRERADMNFDKKELQKLDARKAMAEYDAEAIASRKKTERLRALRLARDAAEAAEPSKPVKAAKVAAESSIPVRLAKKRST